MKKTVKKKELDLNKLNIHCFQQSRPAALNLPQVLYLNFFIQMLLFIEDVTMKNHGTTEGTGTKPVLVKGQGTELGGGGGIGGKPGR